MDTLYLRRQAWRGSGCAGSTGWVGGASRCSLDADVNMVVEIVLYADGDDVTVRNSIEFTDEDPTISLYMDHQLLDLGPTIHNGVAK